MNVYKYYKVPNNDLRGELISSFSFNRLTNITSLIWSISFLTLDKSAKFFKI